MKKDLLHVNMYKIKVLEKYEFVVQTTSVSKTETCCNDLKLKELTLLIVNRKQSLFKPERYINEVVVVTMAVESNGTCQKQ